MGGTVTNPSVVLVPITSDKGLCGAVNTGIVRNLKKMLIEEDITRSKCQIFAIGDKGSKGCMRPFPDMLKKSISAVGTPYNYPTVMAMSVHIN